MTLHDLALKWVAEQVNGEVLHGTGMTPDYLGRIPDVTVKAKRRQYLAELHEVEVLKISKRKIEKYSKDSGIKRFLWVVLPNVEDSFDFIRVIKKLPRKGFEILK